MRDTLPADFTPAARLLDLADNSAKLTAMPKGIAPFTYVDLFAGMPVSDYQRALAWYERLLGEPTLSVGMISGGVKSNVVPDRCVVEVDVRTLPGQSHERFIADLRHLLGKLGVDAHVKPGLGRNAVETDPASSIAAM